jgi:hypothetical protein
MRRHAGSSSTSCQPDLAAFVRERWATQFGLIEVG